MAIRVNGKKVENRGPMYTSGLVSSDLVAKAGDNTELAREAQRLAMVNSYSGKAPEWAGQYSTLNDPRQRAAMDVDYQASLLEEASKSLIASGKGYMENGTYTSNTAKDKAHLKGVAANAGKAYADTAPTTGSLMSQYAGFTPTEEEQYRKARSGSGSATGGTATAGRKKKTLLGEYYGTTAVLGG